MGEPRSTPTVGKTEGSDSRRSFESGKEINFQTVDIYLAAHLIAEEKEEEPGIRVTWRGYVKEKHEKGVKLVFQFWIDAERGEIDRFRAAHFGAEVGNDLERVRISAFITALKNLKGICRKERVGE